MTSSLQQPSVHRIPVAVNTFQEIETTGKPFFVAADRGGGSDVFDLWYEHIPGAQLTYGLHVMGTGHPAPWSLGVSRIEFSWLGTVVTPSGLIWHAYLGPRPRNFPGSAPLQSALS